MEMQIPFQGKKFFTVSYEYSYGGRITVCPIIFEDYDEALHRRDFSFPRTDSFIRAWDNKEDATTYLKARELEPNWEERERQARRFYGNRKR